jgi:hypothetical protein
MVASPTKPTDSQTIHASNNKRAEVRAGKESAGVLSGSSRLDQGSGVDEPRSVSLQQLGIVGFFRHRIGQAHQRPGQAVHPLGSLFRVR